jgi:hypothetical protein
MNSGEAPRSKTSTSDECSNWTKAFATIARSNTSTSAFPQQHARTSLATTRDQESEGYTKKASVGAPMQDTRPKTGASTFLCRNASSSPMAMREERSEGKNKKISAIS